MSRFRFILCPVLSTVPFAEIDLADVQFTQSVDGKGTTLTGSAYLGGPQTAEQLKSILNYPGDPKAIAIYVKYEDSYLWGGVIQTRPWDKAKKAFNITATSWKAWLYQRFLPPDTSTNPVTDVLYSYTNQDQFAIAKNLISNATSGTGKPNIFTGKETSGINRDLSFWGSEFVYAGEAIDRMADREKGFEWDIDIRPSGTKGDPSLWFAPFHPKRQLTNGTILLKSTEFGGNILEYDSPDDSSETVITRVWGTGAGTAGTDLIVAYDEDPDVSNDTVLLVETKEYANGSTTNISTVASHVQGIRQFHASGLQQITLKASLTNPDFRDYAVGNKVRVLVRDEVLDIDFSSVRIVRRTFNVNAAGSTREDYLDLLIDLNDTSLPEDEEVI